MKKLLLIEDNSDIRENTRELLELEGYFVVTASNGREGADLAMQEIPDLIICDILMPLMDGYGVLDVLGKNDATRCIPFIFLTAKGEHADKIKAFALGADDYLVKPYDDGDLLRAIEKKLLCTSESNNQFT